MLQKKDYPTQEELSNEELIDLIKEKLIKKSYKIMNYNFKKSIFSYARSKGCDMNGDIVFYNGSYYFINDTTNTVRFINKDIKISE